MVFLSRHRASLLSKISVWVIVDPIVGAAAINTASWKKHDSSPPFQGGLRAGRNPGLEALRCFLGTISWSRTGAGPES
jgi:hypothetical protein